MNDNGQPPLQCGTCRHWHPVHQPGVIEVAGGRGECRCQPPQVVRVALPIAQRSVIRGIGQEIEMQVHEDALYPKIVAHWPACSLHAPAASA